MTDSQLVEIYNVFYQADSGSSRFAGGLGLGLPIARGLMNAMGGFIHFDSTEQQGLHAHIVIPQGVADDQLCIVLNHADQLCIACYFKPEKYSCDEVRAYYDGLILNLVEGLGIKGYQAHNFEALLKLQRSQALTHVFIAQAKELAGKRGDADYIRERHPELLRAYKELCAHIAGDSALRYSSYKYRVLRSGRLRD